MAAHDQLVCALVHELAVGETFEDWPLHVTIVPWFKPRVGEAVLLGHLAQAVKDQLAFSATVGKDAYFGAKAVSLMQQIPHWQRIQEAAFAVVGEDAVPTAPYNFVGSNFKPHMTVQKDLRLHPGDTFVCDALYVIEHTGEGRLKKVVGKVAFHEAEA